MGATPNDGLPEPSAAGYRLLQTLAWLAAPLVMIFGTVALVGVRRTPDDRGGYLISWPVLTAGLVLPVLAIILWGYFSRGLTTLSVLVWACWAGCSVSGHATASAVAGLAGLAVVVVATATATVARRRSARSDTVSSAAQYGYATTPRAHSSRPGCAASISAGSMNVAMSWQSTLSRRQ